MQSRWWWFDRLTMSGLRGPLTLSLSKGVGAVLHVMRVPAAVAAAGDGAVLPVALANPL